jgi:transposase-like protein
MSKTERRQYSGAEKVKILRLHLLEGKPISDVCEQHGINPSLFYQWQKCTGSAKNAGSLNWLTDKCPGLCRLSFLV